MIDFTECRTCTKSILQLKNLEHEEANLEFLQQHAWNPQATHFEKVYLMNEINKKIFYQ